MMRAACLTACTAGVFLAAVGAQSPTTQQAPGAESPAPSAARSAIQKALQQYVEDFDRHDAGAVAALWAAQAVYENRQTGERREGRDAIKEDLTALFKNNPDIRLDLEADHVRLIRPDVATAEGRSIVTRPGSEPDETAFSAIYVNSEGKWLLNSVEESAPSSPPAPHDALRALEWMLGQWQDQSPDIDVTTTVRWAPSGSFLIRSYEVRIAKDEPPRRGTQIIGWDAAKQRIRSWAFESDGSFGEGMWSQAGDEWVVRITYNMADGRTAAGTQLITRVNDNTMRVQMVGQEIDGEPIPSGEPITVARVPTTQASG